MTANTLCVQQTTQTKIVLFSAHFSYIYLSTDMPTQWFEWKWSYSGEQYFTIFFLMWVVSTAEHARRTICIHNTKDMIMNEVTVGKLIDICIRFTVSEQQFFFSYFSFFTIYLEYSSSSSFLNINQQYIHNLSSLLSLFEFNEITIIWRGILCNIMYTFEDYDE